MGIKEKPSRYQEEFQDKMLLGVSRTFALTIPLLPDSVRFVVTNAYLLCRILDTIEDEPDLTYAQREQFCDDFLDIIFEGTDPKNFAEELGNLLSKKTIEAEHILVRNTASVIEITRSLSANQLAILERCLRTMAKGMLYYKKHPSSFGLANLSELNRYCYFVAGVIGELLTDLFCDYSPAIAKSHSALMSVANSFGQGLQLTNILKDIWEDLEDGICWLPRDVFRAHNFDLSNIKRGQHSDEFGRGLEKMIAITRSQLEKAVQYSLIIPPHEKGIRKFCLWNIGMAALTVKKINNNKDFSSGAQVKISRNSVKLVALASNINITSDTRLKALFSLWCRGLPRHEVALMDGAWYLSSITEVSNV